MDQREFERVVRELTETDEALAALVTAHGTPTLWLRPAGFPSLVLFILEQQVSLASAAAAYRKVLDRTGTRLELVTDDAQRRVLQEGFGTMPAVQHLRSPWINAEEWPVSAADSARRIVSRSGKWLRIAPMSRSSVITSPSKPRSARSRSVTTRRESEEGMEPFSRLG